MYAKFSTLLLFCLLTLLLHLQSLKYGKNIPILENPNLMFYVILHSQSTSTYLIKCYLSKK